VDLSYAAGISFERRSKALGSDERGLILSPPWRNIHGGFEMLEMDLQQLRASLLFWDYLESPKSLVVFDLGPDFGFLEAEGILARSYVKRGVWTSERAYEDYLVTFSELEKSEPGRWSLARVEGTPSTASKEMVSARGAMISLLNAIPVPDRDVPLEDVLEFRRKRRPEMLALRHHLETVAEQIAAAPDRDLALSTELSKLGTALADHERVSKESRFKLRLSDLSAEINLLEIGAPVAAALLNGIPVTRSLLTGAAAGALRVTIGAGFARRKSAATPFEYVMKFHEI
jgi:hypothetical protein